MTQDRSGAAVEIEVLLAGDLDSVLICRTLCVGQVPWISNVNPVAHGVDPTVVESTAAIVPDGVSNTLVEDEDDIVEGRLLISQAASVFHPGVDLGCIKGAPRSCTIVISRREGDPPSTAVRSPVDAMARSEDVAWPDHAT